MNRSDFEETFVAWLDQTLDAKRAATFETEMKARGFDPAAERAAHERMLLLLRAHSTAPALSNADFFNHQLLHRIEQERVAGSSVERAKPTVAPWWQRISRLAWAGAACLLVAGILFKTLIPVGSSPATSGSTYFAQVVDSRTFDPSISSSTVYDPATNVTVLWIDGLDYLPAEYALQ